MSLILEALKKVERERATPEQRGFLVLGQEAWAPSRSNLAWIGGMIVAAAVAGGVVYVSMMRPAPSPVVAAPRTDAVPAPAPPIADQLPSVGVLEPTLRPAAPPAAPRRTEQVPAPAAATSDLQLQAISAQDGIAVAVINQRVVREGDLVDGARIVRIGAAEVVVEVGGVRRTLRF